MSLVVSARFLLRFGDDSEASVYETKDFELSRYEIATRYFMDCFRDRELFQPPTQATVSPLLLPTSPPFSIGHAGADSVGILQGVHEIGQI